MSINSYMAAHLEETAAKIKVVCSGLSHVAAEMEDLKAENAELLKALERATFLLNEIRVLLIRRFSAALAWRASRQTIGNPASVSACHSQVVRVQPDPHGVRSMPADRRLDCRGMTDTGAVPDPFALLIQDMHRRHFQRDVQSDILAHGGSPRMPLHYQLEVLPDLGTAESRSPQTHSFVWRECGCCSSGARAITPCRMVGRRLALCQLQKPV
jgi:hypothetical protein